MFTTRLEKRHFDRKISAHFGLKVGKKATAYLMVHISHVRGLTDKTRERCARQRTLRKRLVYVWDFYMFVPRILVSL